MMPDGYSSSKKSDDVCGQVCNFLSLILFAIYGSNVIFVDIELWDLGMFYFVAILIQQNWFSLGCPNFDSKMQEWI